MKIGIVGLGLIGGSLGLKLQSLNHTIYGIANNDFETYAFYMSEYEDALKRESKRRILQKDELSTRYGDIEHEYYIQTTMKMAEGNFASAYFYLTRYIDVMKNRFLHNQDWKPIPDYAK